MSKAGMVVVGFREIQTLPERPDNEKFQKTNNLSKYLVRTLRKSWNRVKTEWEERQAF